MDKQLFYFKNTKEESIKDEIVINLEDAIKEIYNFPTYSEDEDSFIGFIIEKDIIQFIRYELNEWELDFKAHDLEEHYVTSLNTKQIKDVITSYVNNEDWKRLLAHLDVANYDEGAKKEEYEKDIKCSCGKNIFMVKRCEKGQIQLICTECNSEYYFEINVTIDSNDPVITFNDHIK